MTKEKKSRASRYQKFKITEDAFQTSGLSNKQKAKLNAINSVDEALNPEKQQIEDSMIPHVSIPKLPGNDLKRFVIKDFDDEPEETIEEITEVKPPVEEKPILLTRTQRNKDLYAKHSEEVEKISQHNTSLRSQAVLQRRQRQQEEAELQRKVEVTPMIVPDYSEPKVEPIEFSQPEVKPIIKSEYVKPKEEPVEVKPVEENPVNDSNSFIQPKEEPNEVKPVEVTPIIKREYIEPKEEPIEFSQPEVKPVIVPDYVEPKEEPVEVKPTVKSEAVNESEAAIEATIASLLRKDDDKVEEVSEPEPAVVEPVPEVVESEPEPAVVEPEPAVVEPEPSVEVVDEKTSPIEVKLPEEEKPAEPEIIKQVMFDDDDYADDDDTGEILNAKIIEDNEPEEFDVLGQLTSEAKAEEHKVEETLDVKPVTLDNVNIEPVKEEVKPVVAVPEDRKVNILLNEVGNEEVKTEKLHLSDIEKIAEETDVQPVGEVKPVEEVKQPEKKKGFNFFKKKEKKTSDGGDGNNEGKQPKKKKSGWYYTGVTFATISNVIIIACFVIAYGPFSYLRELFITTAMRTMTHKYLANVIYSTETIQEVLANNVLIEPDQVMDEAAITIGKIEQPTTYSTIYEEQVLKRDAGNDLYKVITLNENGYKGWVVFVYDPTKISLAVSRYLGSEGEFVTTMAQNNGAAVAINGGGFLDAGGYGTGGYPSGYVIQNGALVWSRKRNSSWGGGTIGFTTDGLLLLTKSRGQDAINEGVYNGVDFGPFLIVNGQSAEVSGNGGWGVQPRTCIGQRKDGIVVFLVVDGRTTSSLGIDLNVAIEIMNRYSVYNAANLDGGASSVLSINGELINHPVGWDYTGERGVPNAWIVKE